MAQHFLLSSLALTFVACLSPLTLQLLPNITEYFFLFPNGPFISAKCVLFIIIQSFTLSQVTNQGCPEKYIHVHTYSKMQFIIFILELIENPVARTNLKNLNK